jgi:hypothetical protein
VVELARDMIEAPQPMSCRRGAEVLGASRHSIWRWRMAIISALTPEPDDSLAGITEADARVALQQLDALWDELFPAEQARIVALLVERIEIGTDGLNVRLRVDGLGGLVREMLSADMGAAA